MKPWLKYFLITLCLILTAISVVGSLVLYSSLRHEKLLATEVTVDKKELLAGEVFHLEFSVAIPFELRHDDLAMSLDDEDLIYLAQTLKLEDESYGLHAVNRRYSVSIQSLKDEGSFSPELTALISDKSFKVQLAEMKVKGFVEFKKELHQAQLVLTEEEIKPAENSEELDESIPWTTIVAASLLVLALLLFIVPRLRKNKSLGQELEEALKILMNDKSIDQRLTKSLDKVFDYLAHVYSIKVCSQTTAEALPSLERYLSAEQLGQLKDLLKRADELKFNPFAEDDEESLVQECAHLFQSIKDKTGGTPVLPAGGAK